MKSSSLGRAPGVEQAFVAVWLQVKWTPTFPLLNEVRFFNVKQRCQTVVTEILRQ